MSLVLVESHVAPRDLAAEISRVALDCYDAAATPDDDMAVDVARCSWSTDDDDDDDGARSTSPLSDDKDPVLWESVGRPSSDGRDPADLSVEFDALDATAGDDGDELVVLGVGLSCLARYLAPSGADGSHATTQDRDLRRIVSGWGPWLPRHRCGCVCTTARRIFLAGTSPTTTTDEGRPPERGRMSVRSVDYLTTTSVAACVARQSAMMKLMSQNYAGQRLADDVVSKHNSCALPHAYPSSVNATGRGEGDHSVRLEVAKGDHVQASWNCCLPVSDYRRSDSDAVPARSSENGSRDDMFQTNVFIKDARGTTSSQSPIIRGDAGPTNLAENRISFAHSITTLPAVDAREAPASFGAGIVPPSSPLAWSDRDFDASSSSRKRKRRQRSSSLSSSSSSSAATTTPADTSGHLSPEASGDRIHVCWYTGCRKSYR